jgi:hypothetical protein
MLIGYVRAVEVRDDGADFTTTRARPIGRRGSKHFEETLAGRRRQLRAST